jgi:hypothetical protein
VFDSSGYQNSVTKKHEFVRSLMGLSLVSNIGTKTLEQIWALGNEKKIMIPDAAAEVLSNATDLKCLDTYMEILYWS